MNKILPGLVALGLLFTFGQALQCYQCNIGFVNLCISTTTNCSTGQQCYTGIGTAAQVLNIEVKGCLSADQCNTVIAVTFPGNGGLYSLNRTCCNTNLCNAAPQEARVMLLSLSMATVAGALAAGAVV